MRMIMIFPSGELVEIFARYVIEITSMQRVRFLPPMQNYGALES